MTLSKTNLLDNELSKGALVKPASSKAISKTKSSKLTLRKFQLTGVAFLLNRITKGKIGSGSLLADKVGLGKTIQMLTATHLAKLGTTVIVTKSTLKINMQREIYKWFPRYKIYIIDEWATSQTIAEARLADYVIINYERLNTRASKNNPNPINWHEAIIKYIQPSLLIADEAHMIKNHKSGRHKSFCKISKLVNHTILMTATPISNNTEDLFGLLKIMDNNKFRNWNAYKNRFCRYANDKYKSFLGGKNQRQLNKLLIPMMIRRSKEDVFDELPTINRIPLVLDIDNRDKYVQFLHETYEYNKNRSDDEKYKNVYPTALSIIGEGKLSPIIDWLKNWLEETDNKEKLVVASESVLLSQELHKAFKQQSVMIIGSTPNNKRMPYVDRFNDDPECNFIFGNIQSMGEGLNLDKNCNNLLVAQIPTSMGGLDQILGRIDRMSSTYDKMNMWLCYAPNTMEERKYLKYDDKLSDNKLAVDGRMAHEDEMLGTIIGEELQNIRFTG